MAWSSRYPLRNGRTDRPIRPRPGDLLGPLPLVIGITGHRALRPVDRAGLEAWVRAVFEDLRKRYPATPLVLLSPLAEGADRLATRVALEGGVLDRPRHESSQGVATKIHLLGDYSNVTGRLGLGPRN